MRNTSKIIKGTTLSAKNVTATVEQGEKPWFVHSKMVANIMYSRMKEQGITQKELAEKMNCTQQYISKILKGRENLSLEALCKIELALGIWILQFDSNN